ncbi:MAG: hypothetical protein Q9198_003688 [Flavoplaca austrocitrina]
MPPSPGYPEILNLSHNCARIATELHIELKKLKLHQGSHRQALLKAVSSIRKTRMLKEKRLKLDEYARTLDTVILIRLDTQSLRHSHQFSALDDSVRDLAVKLEQGSNSTAQLLSHQTSQILDHFDRKFDDREGGRRIDQARERFRASLFFPDIEAREDEIHEAFEGTCKWVFDPPTIAESDSKKWHNFREWLETGQDVYWINGKPGAGKSTLMKYIVDEPRTARYLSGWEPNTDLIIATFFFKSLGSELQKSTTGILRSLIWQLIRHWPEMIHLVLKRYKDATGQIQELHPLTMLPTWTDKRLLQVVKDFANEKPATVTLCVFIDGLDEYVGDQDTLLHIIRLLSSAGGCKVCVSSRPDQTFRSEFRGNPQCRVQDLNQRDIEKMVNDKLKPCLEDAKPTETEAIKYLLITLVTKAEGVFLWLSIMIKDFITALRHGDTIRELHKRLETTPNSMYGLYRRILKGLDKTNLDYALKIFQIMVAAECVTETYSLPLTVVGLACMDEASWTHVEQFNRPYFCSSDFRSRCSELYTRLNARCGNLINIKDNEDETMKNPLVPNGWVVEFIHRTVMEFLKDEYVSKFSDKSCLTAAWVPLARARIGSLFLFPFSTSLIGVDGRYTGNCVLDEEDQPDSPPDFLVEVILELVVSTMLPILFGENSSRAVDSEKPPGNAQSVLTAQVLQTLQYLTTTEDVLCGTPNQREYVSMMQLVREALSDGFDLNTPSARSPLEDCIKFAAFWGCESYIRSHLSTETPDELLTNILLSVIKGIHCDMSAVEGFPISSLNIVELLLYRRRALRSKLKNQGIVESADWIKHYLSLGALYSCWSSPWGAFLFQICREIERTLRVYGDSDLFGEATAWIQRCRALVEIFLSEEANQDARIGVRISVLGPIEEFFLFVDMTPLGYVQTFTKWGNNCLFLIKNTLESNGAIERLRYRFCQSKGTYYRIKASQSKSLERLVFSRRYPGKTDLYYWFSSFQVDEGDEPLDILREIFSTNDTLDEDTMEEEWARGGTSWLEDED